VTLQVVRKPKLKPPAGTHSYIDVLAGVFPENDVDISDGGFTSTLGKEDKFPP